MKSSSQFGSWRLSTKLVSHLKDHLMCLVVVRVQLVPDPGHVGLEDRSTLAHIVAGHLGLLELTAGKDIGDRNLGGIKKYQV